MNTADVPVSGFPWATIFRSSYLIRPKQGAQEIFTCHDTDDAVVADDRHPFDSVGDERPRYISELRFLADRDHRRRHDRTRGAVLSVQPRKKLGSDRFALSKDLQPPFPPGLSRLVRRIRSPSLTIPIGAPLLSTTGTALIPLSSITRAILRVGVSGCTETTGLTMISLAFICPGSSSNSRALPRQPVVCSRPVYSPLAPGFFAARPNVS